MYAENDHKRSIEKLFGTLNLFQNYLLRVRKSHPEWVSSDGRVACFIQAINAIKYVNLQNVYLHTFLTNSNYWDHVVGGHEKMDLEYQNFNNCMAATSIFLFHSVLEAAIRNFYAQRGNFKFENSRGIKSVFHDFIFSLGLDLEKKKKFEIIFKILTNLRNTSHNNAMAYFSGTDSEVESLEYRGSTYEFRNGQRITFIDWVLINNLILDSAEILIDVVECDEISRLPYFEMFSGT